MQQHFARQFSLLRKLFTPIFTPRLALIYKTKSKGRSISNIHIHHGNVGVEKEHDRKEIPEEDLKHDSALPHLLVRLIHSMHYGHSADAYC